MCFFFGTVALGIRGHRALCWSFLAVVCVNKLILLFTDREGCTSLVDPSDNASY